MALTVVLLLVILTLRVTIDRRNRRECIIIARWQPIFFHFVEDIPVKIPRLRAGDRLIVLVSWLQFVESIRGEARQRLVDLARTLKLDETAKKSLAKPGVRLKLIGIVALGRFQSVAAMPMLVPLISDLNPMMSLLAARSVLQISPEIALPWVLDQLVRRDDWPNVKVASMLTEIPQDMLAAPLVKLLGDTPPETAARLLGLLDVVRVGDTWPVIEPLLGSQQSAQVLTSALKVCRDPRALDYARRLANHNDWIVRAQAATTLGILGDASDKARLLTMLKDAEWWVRYRAGMALVALPSSSRAELEAQCRGLDDRFALDIMKHVLAETDASARA